LPAPRRLNPQAREDDAADHDRFERRRRALADACTMWAEKNKLVLAMAIIDWGGNVLESHAMEGAAANAIETALLKARSALRWRRPTSETNKLVRSGENLAPTFMNDFPQPGALPIILDGQVIGAMGVSSGDGEKCAAAAIDRCSRDRRLLPAVRQLPRPKGPKTQLQGPTPNYQSLLTPKPNLGVVGGWDWEWLGFGVGSWN
jgi:uncharacterized protein GlcG (DUF336 family)